MRYSLVCDPSRDVSESGVYSIPAHSSLSVIVPGAVLDVSHAGRALYLHHNIRQSAAPFVRSHFVSVPFLPQDRTVYDQQVALTCNFPGSFKFYVDHQSEPREEAAPMEAAEKSESKDGGKEGEVLRQESSSSSSPLWTVEFVVTPIASSLSRTPVSFGSLAIQTVITKLLGQGEEAWMERLLFSVNLGYNCIHFTPVSVTGPSNSPYSLLSHQELTAALSPEPDLREGQLRKVLETLRHEHNCLSMVDIVWNHCSPAAPWLKDHPEAGYTLFHAPHLQPAYLLDRALHEYSLTHNGESVSHNGDVYHLFGSFRTMILPSLHLEEFYLLHEGSEEAWWSTLANSDSNANTTVASSSFSSSFSSSSSSSSSHAIAQVMQRYICHGSYCQVCRQAGSHQWEHSNCGIGFSLPSSHGTHGTHGICSDCQEELRQPLSATGSQHPIAPVSWRWHRHLRRKAFRAEVGSLPLPLFMEALAIVNGEFEMEMLQDMNAAMENCCQAMIYERLDPKGPQLGVLSAQAPMCRSYFTTLQSAPTEDSNNNSSSSKKDDMGDKYRDSLPIALAHNGWVMGLSGGVDFADRTLAVYLRRELIVWEDCIKLRYGQQESDSPYLWQYMQRYTQSMASLFDGFRIDNCHSTPIHVAQALLDGARNVNPCLYVMAELFTGSETQDNLVVSKLGLNSLIREGVHAHSCTEMATMIWKYSRAMPVGNLLARPQVEVMEQALLSALSPVGEKASSSEGLEVTAELRKRLPDAVFADGTHDNELPLEVYSAAHALALAAAVASSDCAILSTRGYDECYVQRLDIVAENRLYDRVPRSQIYATGICGAKKKLLAIRRELLSPNDDQFMCRVDNDLSVIVTTRFSPAKSRAVVFIQRPAFDVHHTHSTPVIAHVLGKPTLVLLRTSCANLRQVPSNHTETSLRGTDVRGIALENLSVDDVLVVEQFEGGVSRIRIRDGLVPGAVVVLECHLDQQAAEAQQYMEDLRRLEPQTQRSLRSLFRGVSLLELQHLLYAHSSESGESAYIIPSGPPLNYNGWMGVHLLLELDIRSRYESERLDHPWAKNVSEGDWLWNYLCERQRKYPLSREAAQFFLLSSQHLAALPQPLKAAGADLLMTLVALSGKYQALLLMDNPHFPSSVSSTSMLSQQLALVSLQMVGNAASAPLRYEEPSFSLAAGLPHFAAGFMRNWGRDTFIALRGLLLLTGRFREARTILLAYAECYWRGLIPNLLDGGRNPRYNARDAVWFWMYALIHYVQMAPSGSDILGDVVRLRRPAWINGAEIKEIRIARLLPTIMQAHADGIRFREERAGSALDEHMTSAGFDISAGVDWKTGFVYGGSSWNCGTWMDKMGSSTQSGNKGHPATPRDGAAIELVALQYRALCFLQAMTEAGLIQVVGVQVQKGEVEDQMKKTEGKLVLWKEWMELLEQTVDLYFYIPPGEIPAAYHQEQFVHRREMYKDTVGSTKVFGDYQLRPNAAIALAVAPNLFPRRHAIAALTTMKQRLLSPLGLRTLDPADWTYHPNYEQQDSDTFATACGFNYHNGPEWIWPLGFFLMAAKTFHALQPEEIRTIFLQCETELKQNAWGGLPELTNHNGTFCPGSCPTQAWSASCLLEAWMACQPEGNVGN